MKFLCLHGNGTNSNIMEMQTAPLRHELDDGHEFEFVEATYVTAMSEGLETITSPDTICYAFYNPDDPLTLQQSVDRLDHYIATTEGGFDGIVGFSGGAVLAAAYLAQKQAEAHTASTMEGSTMPVRCAVFLSSAQCEAEFRSVGLDFNGQDLIQIPTLHIWGSGDQTAPTGGRDVAAVCAADLRLTLVHDGGHEVPRKGRYLTESVHMIRRLVHMALGD